VLFYGYKKLTGYITIISIVMEIITISTIIDITETHIIRNYKKELLRKFPMIKNQEQWLKARRQQSNFDTLVQVISLRTQPLNIQSPVVSTEILRDFRYKSRGRVWTFSFEVEFNNIFYKNDDPLGLLKEDCNNVPVIPNLDSSIKSQQYIKVDTGSIYNTMFKVVTSEL